MLLDNYAPQENQRIQVDKSRYLNLLKSISVKNKLLNTFVQAKDSTKKYEFYDKHKTYRNLILTPNERQQTKLSKVK